jgi:flagellar protein FlaI
MPPTTHYDDFAEALRDQGIEPSAAVLLQNPANFWENLSAGARAGVVEALGLDVDPEEVYPAVANEDTEGDPDIQFVGADELDEAPPEIATDDLDRDPGGAPEVGSEPEPPGGEPSTDLDEIGLPDPHGEESPEAPADEEGPSLGPGEALPGSEGADPGDRGPDPAADAEGDLGPAGLEGEPGPGSPAGESGLGPEGGAGEPAGPDAGPAASGIEPRDDADAGDGPPADPTAPAGDPGDVADRPGTEGLDAAGLGEPGDGPGEPAGPTPGEPTGAEADLGPGLEAEAPEAGVDLEEPPAEEAEAAEPALEEPVPEDEASTREMPEVGPGTDGGAADEPEPADVEPVEELEDFPASLSDLIEEDEEASDGAGLIEDTPDILERVYGEDGRVATEDPGTDRELVTFEAPEDPDLEVVERYAVNEPYAYIRILYDNEEQQYWYEGREPALTEHESTVLDFIEETLVDVIEVGLSQLTEGEAEETLEDHFDQIVYDYSINLTSRSRTKLLYYLKRDFLGFAKIDVLMQDPHIEDISCDGPGISIFLYHRKYESIKSTIRWEDEEDLDSFVIRLAQRSGEHISVADPLLDATLPDGSRLNASLSTEVTSKGSTFTIRKFRDDPFTPTDLVRYGTMDVTMMAFWWFVVQHGASAIYAGGTASGKTTSMNAINLFIPPQMKIVSIEDTREVSLPHENWIPAFTRSGFGPGGEDGQKGEIDMFTLLKAALRQRPEYIMVGEVRGEEAYALFQAMATGHTAYGTMHADSPSSVIHRLESDPISVPRSLLEALDIISIQIQTRIGDKRVRRTKELVEIVGLDPHTREILTNEVFEWDPATDEFEFSGVSYVLERLQMELNMTDEELDKELERRKAVLRWMLQEDIDDLDDVGRVVATYYKDRETLMERIWDDLGEEQGVGQGAGLASSDPGLAGEEIDTDFETDLDDGADSETPDVTLEAPGAAVSEPEEAGGTNGHEPDPALVAMAGAAGEDEALFPVPEPGADRAEVPLEPDLGSMAVAAGEADAPPFQDADHPWGRRWPPTPTVDDDLGFLAEAGRSAEAPPFQPADHPWNEGRWPPTPTVDAGLAALAEGAEPDLAFLPEDHPVRDPPEVGPELGTLARAADEETGLLPFEGPSPGAGEDLRVQPGELSVPEALDRPGAPTAGDAPEPGTGESREPDLQVEPGDVPVPRAADRSWSPDAAREHDLPETHGRDVIRRDDGFDGEPAGEGPDLGEALGLDEDEVRSLREAGYPDADALREATPGELDETDLDADLLDRVRDALGEDAAPADRDPPSPGPDDRGPDPPGFDADEAGDGPEEGRDGAD